jgi:hypothetical protein
MSTSATLETNGRISWGRCTAEPIANRWGASSNAIHWYRSRVPTPIFQIVMSAVWPILVCIDHKLMLLMIGMSSIQVPP